MEFSAMDAIPNGGNRRGKAVFTFAEIGVHAFSTLPAGDSALGDTLIPVVVVPVMIIDVVIAVVIISVSGLDDYDGRRFGVCGRPSE
jgi:hypothetical protein